VKSLIPKFTAVALLLTTQFPGGTVNCTTVVLYHHPPKEDKKTVWVDVCCRDAAKLFTDMANRVNTKHRNNQFVFIH
jgi:hypothetical protein